MTLGVSFRESEKHSSVTQSGKILYVVNAFEKDAPTAVTFAMGKAMRAAGWEVVFVAWSRGGAMEEAIRASGISTRILGKGLVRNIGSLRRLVLDFKPDIVHAVLARPTVGVAVTRQVMGRRPISWIASDHGVHEWHEKGVLRGRVMDFVMPRILSAMDAVVSVSESAADELIRRGVTPGRVRVVPNGIDTGRFYPREKIHKGHFLSANYPRDNPHGDYFLIGSAGNLRELKGYADLVEAMPRIRAAISDARCVVWGNGPERDHLIDRAQELGVGHVMSFCGYNDAMEQRLPLLDLYVQPSRTESFGMAAAEAMACGVPVLVSDTGGLKELVQDQMSGLTFSAGDVAGFANHVISLAGDAAKRARLGEAGRRRINEHFSREQMENGIRKIYDELLSAREKA